MVKYNLLGYDDSYDSIGEYYIIEKYIKAKYNEENYERIIRILYNINNDLKYLGKKDIVLCPFYTLIADKGKFRLDKIKKMDKSLEILDNLKNLYILFLFSFKNQYYYLCKGSILNSKEYEKMKNDLKYNIKILNKYILEFMDNSITKKDDKYILIKDILNKSDDIFNKFLEKNNNKNNNINLNDKYLNMFNKFYKII